MQILDYLAEGWKAAHADVARDLVRRWKTTFSCECDIRSVQDSCLTFVADMHEIRLRGMHAAPVMLVGGEWKNVKADVIDFVNLHLSSSIPIILCATESLAYNVRMLRPSGQKVVLSPTSCLRIFSDSSPIDALRQELRTQIPLQYLNPFNIERPAEGGMFTGRSKVIQRLASDYSSFALPGPPRVGKSSVLRNLRRRYLKDGDPAYHSTFYVDLFRIRNPTTDTVAQQVALTVDGRSNSANITSDRLEPLLQYWSTHYRRAITLLLDEVDASIHFDVYDQIEMCARKGYCRYILAGKAELLKVIQDNKRAFCDRLLLQKLDPLTDPEVETLFVAPMQDLGITLSPKGAVVAMIHELTGNHPQNVQYYGTEIVNLLIQRDSRILTTEVVEEVRDSFATQTRFMGSIQNLTDPLARRIANLMVHYSKSPYPLKGVHDLLRHHDIACSEADVLKCCNELVLNNILAWNRGFFQVANGSLVHHARMSGYTKPLRAGA